MKTGSIRALNSTLLAAVGLLGVLSADAQNGTWSTKAPMPQPRVASAGAVVQGRLILIGGSTGDGAERTPEIYDPLLDEWTFGAPAAISRAWMDVAVIDDKIYVPGGWINADANAGTAALEVYDPATDSWSSRAPMSAAKGSTACAAMGGKLYVAGGIAPWFNDFADLEIYDPLADSWSHGAPLPLAVGHAGSAVFNGKLYVIGGVNFHPTRIVDSVQIYDPVGNTWTMGTPMPGPRAGAKIAAVNGKLMVVGGNDGSGSVTTVELYDPVSDSWSGGVATPEISAGGALGVIDSRVYYAGGYDSSGDSFARGTLYVFTLNTPPVARCRDVSVSAGASCDANATIDNGSFDPDPDDSIAIAQSPSGPYPLGTTVVTLNVTDSHGASSSCTATVTVVDSTPPVVTCPQNISVGCSPEALVPVSFSATASDACDSSPGLSCSPPSGSGFPIGTTTVNCVATDGSGNQAQCSFTVTRAPLNFSGFAAPIGGADGSGGSFANPLRTFKMSSPIPVKFTASCTGAPVLSGLHKLQVIKFSDATTSGTPIDAMSKDLATSGNEFRLADGQWYFNLAPKPTGMSVGIWKLIATLSDGSQHSVWIQLK